MSHTMMAAILLASIADGHTDLADLLFLLSAILLTLVFVVELLNRNIVVSTKALTVAGVALLAWAWFVL